MSRTVDVGGEPMSVSARKDPERAGGFVVQIGERTVAVSATVTPDGGLVIGMPDGRSIRAVVTREGSARWVRCSRSYRAR